MVMNWTELRKLVALKVHTLLYGPPGTGKTTVAMNPRALSITLTAETPAAELRGHYIPKGNEFIWQDGPAITAWRQGLCLVLNEIVEASGDALTFLYALLDDPKMARITLPTGETVTPAPGFYCVATMNGQPMDLPPALLDRFMARVYVDEPSTEALEGVSLMNSVIDTLHVVEMDRKITLRQAKGFDYLAQRLGGELASKAVFGKRHAEILNTLKIAQAPLPAGETPVKRGPGRPLKSSYATGV